jgi:hypothetical protein
MTLWRERWIRHGIGLPMGIGTDSANFPSDFNFPVVIFLQDYPISDSTALWAPRRPASTAESAQDSPTHYAGGDTVCRRGLAWFAGRHAGCRAEHLARYGATLSRTTRCSGRGRQRRVAALRLRQWLGVVLPPLLSGSVRRRRRGGKTSRVWRGPGVQCLHRRLSHVCTVQIIRSRPRFHRSGKEVCPG